MPINTRVHGVLDYAMGLLLLSLPFLFQWGDGPQSWVPMALGAAALAYSALTDYELGLVRVLPMPVHLLLDTCSGALLALSPWLFGFDDVVWLPHLLLGLTEITAAALTDRRPRFAPTRVQRRAM